MKTKMNKNYNGIRVRISKLHDKKQWTMENAYKCLNGSDFLSLSCVSSKFKS